MGILKSLRSFELYLLSKLVMKKLKYLKLFRESKFLPRKILKTMSHINPQKLKIFEILIVFLYLFQEKKCLSFF